MSETNGNRSRRSVDVIEDNVQDEGSSFYDPANPIFAPPKTSDNRNKKTWKRKLITWCFVLFLVASGVLALYLLLRVKHVNVRVQADPRRETTAAKGEPSPNNPENGLSAEAIDIARQAIGPDSPTATNATSTSATSAALPSPSADISRVLSFTDNSPAYSHANDVSSTNVTSNQAGVSETQQQVRELSVPALQSRANPTQTLFVEDLPAKLASGRQPGSPSTIRLDKALSNDTSKISSPSVLPLFGTMLPVRTQGVIFSLRKNSFARLELARDCQGEGWALPKGTLLIGRVNGSQYDRAFINIQGYIDPRTNRFVKMTGEVLGSDGGSGMQGKRVVVDRNRLKQTLSKVASSGLQVAGMMAGALTGRGTVVLNGAGYRVLNPVTDEAGRIVNADAKRSFVKVEAGQPAYVMVADLPKELHAIDAPGEEEFTQAVLSLTDREVMELILFGTPDDIRAALPLMNDEQKQLVVKSIGTEK